MKEQLYCGAAKIKVTPWDELYPIEADPGRVWMGTIDDLYARAVALKAGGTTMLILSYDISGAPYPQTFVPLITEATGIPEQNILYFGTHNHSSITPKERTVKSEKIDAYIAFLKKAAVQVAVEAVNSMRPARFGYGEGKSYINVNRNQVYYVRNEKNEIIDRYCLLGQNWEGPSDKTLAVMRFEDMDGKVIAFFVNFGVHCNTLWANQVLEGGKMGISSGLAGLTSKYIEGRFKDSVAIWSSGSAGDQGAIFMNHVYYPSPETGDYYETAVKNGDYENVQALAARHFDDILLANDKIVCDQEQVTIQTAMGMSETPGRDARMANENDDPNSVFVPRDVRLQIYKDYVQGNYVEPWVYKDSDDPYKVRLQLMKLGDVALLGVSGELYTTLGLHLKSISPLRKTVIVTHASSRMVGSQYIYDDEGCVIGGNGGLQYFKSRMKPGYIKDALSRLMLELFGEVMD